MKDLPGYDFYRALTDGRTTRPLRTELVVDKEPYYNRLSQLVQNVTDHLEELVTRATAPPVVPAVATPPQQDAAPCVLLLEVTDDLVQRRAELRDYLEQSGVRVLPEKRYSRDDVALHREQMLADFARSRACVQILGPLAGDRSDHPRGLAWLRFETVKAAGGTVPFLQWRDPDLDLETVADVDARALIEPPSVRTDRFPDFRRAVSEIALKPVDRGRPRPQDVLSVFVNSDLLDRGLGTGVAKWLETQGFLVLEPPQSTSDAREEWETNLKYCNSLVLVYGQTKPGWVKTQILLSNKVQRDTPLDLVGVCVGPPPAESEQDKVSGLALRYTGIHYLRNEDSCEPKPIEMQKFATKLRESMPTPDTLRPPYPGLRPFEADEADLFFGREQHVDALLERLSGSRFVAVVGESGAGKSSLVRAGLLPALEAGFVVEAGSDWRVALMRPGGAPLHALADALLTPGVLYPDDAGSHREFALAELRRGPFGLARVVRDAHLGRHCNTLIVVDQFEELFRYCREPAQKDQASIFVELLLQASHQRQVPVFVVLTMRSDFLGDCARFRGLPEALNDNQYLTPRLTREQLAAAVSEPARVCGGTVETALVDELCNAVGDDQDQLPLLQHLLMRLWDCAGEQARPAARDGGALSRSRRPAAGAQPSCRADLRCALGRSPDDRPRHVQEPDRAAQPASRLAAGRPRLGGGRDRGGVRRGSDRRRRRVSRPGPAHAHAAAVGAAQRRLEARCLP